MIETAQIKTVRDFNLPQIDIAFQPIFDIYTSRVRFYEALVRGPNGESAASILELIPPEASAAFDDEVRITAVKKAARLGLVESGAGLSINLDFATDLMDANALDRFATITQRLGLHNWKIIFELTENTRLTPAEIGAVVSRYCAHGFSTALDDFGAGYSGLVTLAEVPTDFVKLDMDLIHDIDSSPVRAKIVAGIVGVLENLGRRIVAEGVETAAELYSVKALGIRKVQGFLLGRPSMTELQAQPYVHALAA